MPHATNPAEPQEVGEDYVRPMGQQQAKALKKKHGVDEERAATEKEHMALVRANSIQAAKRVKHLKTIAKSARSMAKDSRAMREHAILSVDVDKLKPAFTLDEFHSNRRWKLRSDAIIAKKQLEYDGSECNCLNMHTYFFVSNLHHIYQQENN